MACSNILSIIYSFLALCIFRGGRAGWVDPDTEPHQMHIYSLEDGRKYKLVMSDEFETEHRSFKDGYDPKWTALHKNDCK